MNILKAASAGFVAWLVFSVFFVMVGTWIDLKPYSSGEFIGQYACERTPSWKYDASNMYACDPYSLFKQQLPISFVFYSIVSIVGIPILFYDSFAGKSEFTSIGFVIAVSPITWTVVAVLIQFFVSKHLRRNRKNQ